MKNTDLKIKILTEKLEKETGKKVVLQEATNLKNSTNREKFLKSFPYKISLTKSNLNYDEVAKKLSLIRLDAGGNSSSTNPYSWIIYSNKDNSIAIYSYQQSLSTNFNLEKIYFKDKEDYLKFKKTI